MNVYLSKNQCCGCTACYSICPKNAIQMQGDEKGFLYPTVDENLCVKCQMCVKVCDFQGTEEVNHLDIKDNLIYAVKHKDIDERLTSRSGGTFMAICQYVLDKKGVVYGAAFDENLKVVHKRAEDKKTVNEFKGSKYVQSEMGDTFFNVKKDLNDGKVVLFSGTGCQTAGLKSYLKKQNTDTRNLILCDIVCHGVPSPLVYEKYLDYLSKKYNSKITQFNFRDKYFGWSAHIESFLAKKKRFSDLYTDLFYKHIMFRPACSECKYANFNRPSDITLADFWGIDKAVENFNDNKGVSLIIINTEKGEKIFNDISKILDYKKSNKKDCLQPNLEHPSIFSDSTEDFWIDFNQKGIEYVMKKYGSLNFKSQLKFKIKVLLYKYHLRGM